MTTRPVGPRTKIVAALATALVLGAGSAATLTVAPASASGYVENGATLKNGSWTTYAYLNRKGTHLQVRAVQICTTASGQTEFNQYGNWVSYGHVSRTASCPNSRVHGATFNVRYV